MALTDLQVKKLVPRSDRFEVVDGKGLSIRIMPTGSKSWIFRYTIDGTRHRMTLGSYPSITLAEIREIHAKALQEVERGIDPSRKQKEAKANRKASPTVADLLVEFWEEKLIHTPSGKERKRLIEKDAIPAWGKRKVSEITRRDAVLLIDEVRKRAKVGANRLQSILVGMLNFAAERGIIEHSPLSGLRKRPEKARSRVLTDAEISLLWTSLDLASKEVDAFHLTKLALKMILLTGQRPGEVSGMEWGEIDGDTWSIPAHRSKNRQTHTVPLSPLALELLEMAKPYSGETPFVFSSINKGHELPLTTNALSRAIHRHRAEIGIDDRFTPHDLRRTVRTRLAELKVTDIVAEKVLGHKLQGILVVYNHHPYGTEKLQAIEQWEKKLRQLVGIDEAVAGKIIEMRRHHAS
ncbi:MAG: tyrosine-type recombinase/integrase [Proteobacteria bacterium]|nr:tyrosine-type recombinase/integrase [Desulfobulbaceae bacterium]MBU4153618.1 tyrosine-type recombinase/integrase [Pseudomonadota bacterium]